MNTKREPGFYWIKLDDDSEWSIAEYDYAEKLGGWWSIVRCEEVLYDDEVFKIDERQIIRTP